MGLPFDHFFQVKNFVKVTEYEFSYKFKSYMTLWHFYMIMLVDFFIPTAILTQKKNSVKVLKDEFYNKFSSKMCFFESNSFKYRKLPQMRPPKSNSMQNLGRSLSLTLFVPSCSCTILKYPSIFILNRDTRTPMRISP